MTVLEKIILAIKKHGGKATYAEIYEAIEEINGYPLTKGQMAGIRRRIKDCSSECDGYKGDDLFYSVYGKGKGTWGLRDYNP